VQGGRRRRRRHGRRRRDAGGGRGHKRADVAVYADRGPQQALPARVPPPKARVSADAAVVAAPGAVAGARGADPAAGARGAKLRARVRASQRHLPRRRGGAAVPGRLPRLDRERRGPAARSVCRGAGCPRLRRDRDGERRRQPPGRHPALSAPARRRAPAGHRLPGA
ncbi:hypothetical protein IWQ57_004754, partial [Coemansia nantahalensis]